MEIHWLSFHIGLLLFSSGYFITIPLMLTRPSAVLSNVYMLEFDKKINDYVSKYDGKYMRYSDDFLIVFPYDGEKKIQEHKDFVCSQVICTPGLTLQEKKTATYVFQNGLLTTFQTNEPAKIDYLGFVFDGSNIKLRPKAITKYYYRMRRKARNIGRKNWKSPKEKRISAKNLYAIYSENEKQQTFID